MLSLLWGIWVQSLVRKLRSQKPCSVAKKGEKKKLSLSFSVFIFSCSEQELLFVVMLRLLTAVASLVEEHRLSNYSLQTLGFIGFSSCGSESVLHRISCSKACGILLG